MRFQEPLIEGRLIERYKRFPFKPGVLEQILWDNPARLLGIRP